MNIVDSSFVNSSLYVSGWCSTIDVYNSTFASNRDIVSAVAIETNYQETIWFENNRFADNSNTACIGIRLLSSQDVPGNISIIGNTFQNNTVASVIVINEVMFRSVNVSLNVFQNPQSNYDLSVLTLWKPGYYISATNNYWGGASRDWVLSRISDFYTDIQRAVVDMPSVFATSSMNTMVNSGSWSDWNMTGREIGGRLIHNVTIDPSHLTSSLNLTVVRSIFHLYPNLVISTSETSVEFVIFFLFLQPQLLQIHLSPANLTTVIHYTLASHKQISTNFNAFKTHWHASSQTLQNTNTSHQYSKNYTGFQSNKESITNSVFSHTKHSQINNLHIFTIVFHFRHILFLQDLLIHLFFPFHMSDHHLAKGLSLSLVHDSGIHSLLIPETRLLCQYSVPSSKHTFSKLHSLPRLLPISLDCLPGF